jgi:uncharacterized membrane protein YkvA (DUF1232 family)
MDALPEATREAFASAYPSTPGKVDELLTRVGRHAAETHSAATKSEAIDLSLALRIAQRLRAVLQSWETYPAPHQAAIQAAIAYYALNEDGHSDLQTLAGFEDDAAVVNAVLAYIGRRDLCIRFA